MADNSTTIIGNQKKAAGDGTETRKKMKKWGWPLFILLLVVIAISFMIFWGYQIFGTTGTASIVSQPVITPSPPTRYTDGMQLHLTRPGESHLISLAGEIKITNFKSGHCVWFVPINHVQWDSNPGNTEILVKPRGGNEKLVTISLIGPGEETCPRR